MIMALLGVLALVFLLFWIMKRFNKMLLLVSVCGKCMVLGVTSNHTEKICELEQSEEELTKLPEGGNPSFGESFKIVLGNMMNKKK